MTQALLREFIEHALLSEMAAVSARMAAKNGLAMFSSLGEKKSIIVFDPSKALDIISRSDSISTPADIVAPMKSCVVGYISARGKNNVVSASAAERGYGPLVYDAAITLFGSLTPDFVLSDAALAVWQYYYEKRNDVKRRPLEDDVETDDPTQYTYYGLKTNISGMSDNATSFFNAVKKNGTNPLIVRDALKVAGFKFADERI